MNISGMNGEVMSGEWKFHAGPSVGISVGDELWAAARYILERITEVAGVVLSFDPKPTQIGKERGHTKITGFANRKASICVGRDIEKEGKGYYEEIRPASNMDLYLATSMIVETTILWKP
ncbi:glutamine synthetase nodule isozyme-like [Populus alba x Populus x berolinensis]|nr:glutamine synthetase nodule isozyme-like [Populus alba x Populus x berolinensis]